MHFRPHREPGAYRDIKRMVSANYLEVFALVTNVFEDLETNETRTTLVMTKTPGIDMVVTFQKGRLEAKKNF